MILFARRCHILVELEEGTRVSRVARCQCQAVSRPGRRSRTGSRRLAAAAAAAATARGPALWPGCSTRRRSIVAARASDLPCGNYRQVTCTTGPT